MPDVEKAQADLPSRPPKQEQALLSPSSEVALSRDGFKLFPQPVIGDELDPLNWSSVQKHVILAIIMALYFMFTYITTTTVPSFPALQDKYGISFNQVNWTVAIPALGLSVGPLLWSSLAEIIGRRPVLLLGTFMAFVATVGAALAPRYAGYMAARFFQGFGVSPASSVGFAIINDLFFEHERGQKVGLWVLAIDLGLLFGPLLGGFVVLAGHTWIQWVSAIAFGVILLSEMALLPETLYPRSLIQSRYGGGVFITSGKGASPFEQSLVRRTKELPLWSVTAVPGVQHPRPYETLLRFFEAFKLLAVSISVTTYCFGWYWWVLSVVTVIPVAYPSYSPQDIGLLYIGLIVGTLCSEVLCSGTLSDWIVVKLARRNSNTKTPEMRIWLAYPAAVLTSVGLVLWGISVDRRYHWMVGQVALALFGAGIQMGNTAVCSYIFDSFPMQSMAIMTFYAVLLNLSAFVDPFFIGPWLDSVGFTWTFAGHAIITFFFCVPVMAGLHKYGPHLRQRWGSPGWVNPEFDKDAVQLEHLPEANKLR